MLIVDVTDSTQHDARRLIAGGCPHGASVLARRQQQARGRLGRRWSSDHDGLWLSVVLRPALPMARAPRLTLAIADGLQRCFEARGLPVWIKWPNDLLVATTSTPSPVLGPFRKAGGLIVEATDVSTTASGLVLQTCIVGVGINLWRPPGGFAAELAEHAGALQDVGFVGDNDDRVAVAAEIVACCIAAVDDTADDAFVNVCARLLRRSATVGRRVAVDGVVGVATGFSADGALVVTDDDGTAHTISAGDVAVMP